MFFIWKDNLESTGEKSCSVIIVIGLGLIGSAISEVLRQNLGDGYNIKKFKIPWQNESALSIQLGYINLEMEGILNDAGHVEAIWSAGKAGFQCQTSEAAQELANFGLTIQWLQHLKVRHQANVNLSLISSLGGLFESAGLIDETSTPQPQRIYGHLKLEQEKQLVAASDIGHRIYRVSSVYGHVSQTHRMSLIPTLVANGILKRTTSFNGRLSTLRDYIWVDDLAGFVVKKLRDPSELGSVVHMASYTSYSIEEIKEKVESLLNHQLKWSFAASLDNARSMSVSSTLRPAAFSPSDIDANLRLIISNAREVL